MSNKIITLSTGRKVVAFDGVVGIGPDLRPYGGFDQILLQQLIPDADPALIEQARAVCDEQVTAPIQADAYQAVAMLLIAERWLRDNAPERLRKPET